MLLFVNVHSCSFLSFVQNEILRFASWVVEYYGDVQFDDTFNPSTADAQQHLEYVCDVLLTNYSTLLYDTADYFTCWVYDFREYGEGLGLQFPFILSDDDDQQYVMYNELVSNWTTQTQTGIKYASRAEIGVIDDVFTFAYIEFKIPHSQYLTEKDALFNEWEDIMKDFNDLAPEGVNKAFQATSFAWPWMASQRSFVVSAVQGIAIAIPLALLCLVLSTQNWIISLFATSAIVGIILCEVALMVLQNWELGISESIAVVMIVGFSVDYVVHIGMAYIECEASAKRNDRIKFSLFTMGISVVSGGMTTFGSGFWLIFPEFLFFKKFGILVMSVVSFSLFFAMVYFIALLAKCGPQGTKGNVPIIKWIGKLLSPLSKCWCSCCIYCCCCCGTMDDYYVEQELENRTITQNVAENDSVQKESRTTELVVREAINETQKQ